MRNGVQRGVLAIVAAVSCLAPRLGNSEPTNQPTAAGATNGITVTVVIKDGRRKTVAIPADRKPTALSAAAMSGAIGFCSHDYGGDYVLRTVPEKGEVKIPFDVDRIRKGGPEGLDVRLLDKDTVVLPHMRSGAGFGPDPTGQPTNAPYSDPAARPQKR